MELVLGTQTAGIQNTNKEIEADRNNILAEFHVYSLVSGFFYCKVQTNVTNSWHLFPAINLSPARSVVNQWGCMWMAYWDWWMRVKCWCEQDSEHLFLVIKKTKVWERLLLVVRVGCSGISLNFPVLFNRYTVTTCSLPYRAWGKVGQTSTLNQFLGHWQTGKKRKNNPEISWCWWNSVVSVLN